MGLPDAAVCATSPPHLGLEIAPRDGGDADSRDVAYHACSSALQHVMRCTSPPRDRSVANPDQCTFSSNPTSSPSISDYVIHRSHMAPRTSMAAITENAGPWGNDPGVPNSGSTPSVPG